MLAHSGLDQVGATLAVSGCMESAPGSTSMMLKCLSNPSAAKGPSALRGRLLRGATSSRGNSMSLEWVSRSGSAGSRSLKPDDLLASTGRGARTGSGAETVSVGLKAKIGSRMGRKSSLSQASSEGGTAGWTGTTLDFQACVEGCSGVLASTASNSPRNPPAETTNGPGKASGTAFWAALASVCIWL